MSRRSKIGIFKSLKPNEKRIPIHPSHLSLISQDIKRHLYFEKGYGQDFGLADSYFMQHSAGVENRESLLNTVDRALILKPIITDLQSLRENAIVSGWTHCVQQPHITQVAIDKKLTLIAFEEMHYWEENRPLLHVFYKNNEIAGLMGVSEALRLCGYEPYYGETMKAVVIGFGSVGRGAVYSLKRQGVNDITVLSRRSINTIHDQIHGVKYQQIIHNDEREVRIIEDNGNCQSLFEVIKRADIIVNAIQQDVEQPMIFIYSNQIHQMKSEAIIVDISCDEGMGFEFAEPTSFDKPIRKFNNLNYYSVDHIPSCVWRSASYEISKSLIPFLPLLAGNEDNWNGNKTIFKAIEILKGHVKNPKIISFQKRDQKYPHCLTSHLLELVAVY